MKLNFKYENKFIILHLIIIVMIMFYALIAWFCDYCDKYVIYALVTTVVIYILNICLYKVNYFENICVFYMIKLIQLIIASLIIFQQNRFLSNTGVISYILLCIEAIVAFGTDNRLFKYNTLILAVLPFTIGSTYIFVFQMLTIDTLFFMLLKIVILIGVYFIFFSITNELKNQIIIHKDLCSKLNYRNEELRVSQQQFQVVHNQLVGQKAELEEANKRLNRFTAEMYIQNELLRYISSVLDIEELMELVTDSILGAIGVNTCSLVIYDTKKDYYYYKVKSTHDEDYSKCFVSAINSGILNQYFKIGEPYIDNNVSKGSYEFTCNREIGSLVIIPILNDNITYGLLIAEHESSNIIKENSLQFFQGIANQINIAINNANLYAKMEKMAKLDGLTNVYNRKHFQKVLEDYSIEAVKNNKKLSLVLFDIDKFKVINDTYGHIFGDIVLKSVASITEKCATLHSGITGRYGGEEFVIVFPDKAVKETLKIMEIIHERIKEEKIFNNGELVNVNISIGITSYPELCNSTDELIRRADKAMYYSKAHGRGRITIDNMNL